MSVCCNVPIQCGCKSYMIVFVWAAIVAPVCSFVILRYKFSLMKISISILCGTALYYLYRWLLQPLYLVVQYQGTNLCCQKYLFFKYTLWDHFVNICCNVPELSHGCKTYRTKFLESHIPVVSKKHTQTATCGCNCLLCCL